MKSPCYAVDADPFPEGGGVGVPSRTTVQKQFDDFFSLAQATLDGTHTAEMRRLCKTIIHFAELDGHFFETQEDAAQLGYSSLIEEEYKPLLRLLKTMGVGTQTPADLFPFVFKKFIEHLKCTADQMKFAHEEDETFRKSKGTEKVYLSGGRLNFFRTSDITPTYENFLKHSGPLENFWKGGFQTAPLSTKHALRQRLNPERDKLRRLREIILPYRDETGAFYCALLKQSWDLLPDPTILPKKLKRQLNIFPYLHPILGHASDSADDRTLDDIAKEYAFENAGDLKVVIDAESKKIKKSVNLHPTLCKPPLVSSNAAAVDPSAAENEARGHAIEPPPLQPFTPTTVPDADPEKTTDSGGGGAQKFEKIIPKERPLSAPSRFPEGLENHIAHVFSEFRDMRNLKYKTITTLLSQLGGICKKNTGSHERWTFKNLSGQDVNFSFWRLHGKDRYGPWTKKLILDLEEKLLE